MLLMEKSGPLRYDAQTLIAITFSLWRAAFLAGRSASGAETAAHAKEFLYEMIANNAINYPQDKAARNWTFNYYVANARNRLKDYVGIFPDCAVKESILMVGSRLPAKKTLGESSGCIGDCLPAF